ncbi:MAG TPA: polysaccharide deacetylase family protein [bacterium]
MTGRLPILTFHALDDVDRSAIACSPPRFAEGIETLAGLDAHTLGMGETAGRLRSGGSFPRRAFGLTFDDGYRSVHDVAFPQLLRWGLTATVFLAVGRGRTGANDRLPSMNGRPMLSWGEIRAMHQAGLTFGAHTLTHPNLSTLPPPQVREEILDSKTRIEDALGAPVRCFAYPYGAADRESRRVVAEHFDCACSDRLGLVHARSDMYALERVDAYYLGTRRLFGMIFTTMFPWYLSVRNVPRVARRRLETVVRRPFTAIPGDRSHEEVVHGR